MEFEHYDFMQFLDQFTMYIFVIDIILGFNTSFINVQSGEEIFGYSFIAKNYIFNGTFVIDLLSTFQIDRVVVFFPNVSKGVISFLKLLGFLKIQRLRRISKIIGQMNQT